MPTYYANINPVAFHKKSEFEQAINQLPEDWTPPGKLIKSIEHDGDYYVDTYEVWQGSLADPAVKQLVNRIQICVLFYIEGGSFIGKDADGNDEPDYSLDRWNVYFIYKKAQVKSANQYTFVGYSTVYDFWRFEPPTPPTSPGTEVIQPKVDDAWELPTGSMPYRDMPHRARISQFVILPPFQGKGFGATLYNTIFQVQSMDASTKEITVEDPNEAFDLLRDLCDLKYLRKNVPEFTALSITPDISVPQKGGILHHNLQVTDDSGVTSPKSIVDLDALEALRVRLKIAPRQFSRLVEMHLMSKLPVSVRPLPLTVEKPKGSKPSKEDLATYTLWRLLLKQRVYRRNATLLEEFEITERIIKLNETLENIEFEYAAILERLGTYAEGKGKRKADDEDEDQQITKKRKGDVEDA